MSENILGLDLGTTSIGWALVKEGDQIENSEIIKLGVRVTPLSVDEKTNFEKGRPLTTNADRTLKRSARRNLQRYKLRRENLIQLLIKANIISKDTLLTEIGKGSTYNTLKNRANAVSEKIELEDFAKVLLSINKKRGYKSSRKTKVEDEGVSIDGMSVAKIMYEDNLTPGEYTLRLLEDGKKYIPDFYRSDLLLELEKIWKEQKLYYPNVLSDEVFEELQNKNKTQTWAICAKFFNIQGVSQKGSTQEKKRERYLWRKLALNEKLDLEYLAIVFQDINSNISQSSGYLGAISDRSKHLFFNKITVGEYLYNQIVNDKHTSLKTQVFYRQDYLDEFEKIWEMQAKYYSIFTSKLKEEVRDVIIFYQRKLRSQKGLISFCRFESKKEKYTDLTTGKERERTIGNRVCAKSSPLFQEFKIWQNLNDLEFNNEEENVSIIVRELDQGIRQELFNELNIKGDLKSSEILNILSQYFQIGKKSNWTCNFDIINGNKTNLSMYKAFKTILENEGYGFDWSKRKAIRIIEEVNTVFTTLGITTDILKFDPFIEGKDFDKQKAYQFWHLLYSAEDDSQVSKADQLQYGSSAVQLKKSLHKQFGFKPEYSKLIANISLEEDYSGLSTKAIRNIYPFLQAGHIYSEACLLAGYNHSNSLTKEELAQRILKPKLELVPKNSLRNPVVEKILNQTINLVNQVIDEYGKPNEIRIELARELKKTAKQRGDLTSHIVKATKANELIKKKIEEKFKFKPTKNDVVKYKLYEELKNTGYKTVFTGKYIPEELLFTKDIEVEHIIPKALLFDDSFSNKTLAFSYINRKKANRTAIDYIREDHKSDEENFKHRVEQLYNNGKIGISKGKYLKLLTSADNLPEGFVKRDLNNTQYIAKKAYEMLSEVFEKVTVTTGEITNKLREDWGLINVMKELNLPKYKVLGLTDIEVRKGDKSLEVIKDWTKRNDHRHHAMDALTVAFTTQNHIQYINNLSGRKNKSDDDSKGMTGIKKKITYVNEKGKRLFLSPIPNFRKEAKLHINDILVSFKTKNKVVTRNINKTKEKNGFNKKIQSTPRGQLHKETIYGMIKRPMDKDIKLNMKISIEQVSHIIDVKQRKIVLKHLEQFENKPGVAFDTKTLKKYPISYNGETIKSVRCYEQIYTIRKSIAPDLKIEKIIDPKIRQLLYKHLEKYNNDPKLAFSDIDKNPIWLNKEKGVKIKRVKIKGINNAEALHVKRDHLGNSIHDSNGNLQPADFVSTGNNHHVAIYKDKSGKLYEQVVSFYEAVARVNAGLPIVDKMFNRKKGWVFMFTMKQNEMFVIPSENFSPLDVNLKDSSLNTEISKHLYRVQKIATKNYFFRYHLETNVDTKKALKDIAYINYQSVDRLKGIVKVRINHLGQIVHIGEY